MKDLSVLEFSDLVYEKLCSVIYFTINVIAFLHIVGIKCEVNTIFQQNPFI